MAGERTVLAMQLSTSTRPTPHLGSLIGGTLLGALCVTAGLLLAYLTLETPFVAVVIHELPRPDIIRPAIIRPASAPETSWEIRTSDGWWPTEHPLDRAARDADRVRRWFADGDLEFVVRVYAAVVAPDGMLARSPAVAVIRADQIREWLAALPGQRSLTVGRRERLLALVRTASRTSGRTARR